MDEALAARKGEATPADIAAELDIDDRLDDAGQVIAREKATLEVAETRLDVLQRYTAERTKKERVSDIERKRTVELAKRAALSLEKDREAKLERQIKACALVAPSDGVVVYANDPIQRGRDQIEEGATVRERQRILSVVDLDAPMRVNARVREPRVDRIKQGQPARIRVDAFPGRELTGVVVSVAPRPDPAIFFSESAKIYPTRIQIDDGPRGLRPGMSAEVEIPILELDDVLTVPCSAVLHFDGKDHVAVTAPGTYAWREVTLGESNDASVEVKQGLRVGESVILDPAALMSEAERRAKLGAPTRPAEAPPSGRGRQVPRER
jgi:RND family efflux transporter MFP subunit